jgi:hypothetical protein
VEVVRVVRVVVGGVEVEVVVVVLCGGRPSVGMTTRMTLMHSRLTSITGWDGLVGLG